MKVRLETAQEAVAFEKMGYEVECWIVPPKQPKRKNGHHVKSDDLIGLSVEGEEPTKGLLQAAWLKTKKELWGKDVTATYRRQRVVNCLTRHGAYAGAFYHLLRNYEVLREIEDE